MRNEKRNPVVLVLDNLFKVLTVKTYLMYLQLDLCICNIIYMHLKKVRKIANKEAMHFDFEYM